MRQSDPPLVARAIPRLAETMRRLYWLGRYSVSIAALADLAGVRADVAGIVFRECEAEMLAALADGIRYQLDLATGALYLSRDNIT